MKRLVISGINIFQGGTLSVYYDCLDCILKNQIYKDWDIIAFVHKKDLFSKYKDNIQLIELPKSRKSYLHRLYYEYLFFEKWSRNKQIDVWLSLHDITPNVHAERIYTYCHNPSPFMKPDLSKLKYNPTYTAFALFYKYLYRINIKKAAAIIVQQDWIRKEFLRMYPIDKVIVARPCINIQYKFTPNNYQNKSQVFIFASYPRFFKNFEVICEASKELSKNTNLKYEIWLTIDGTENRYSRDLRAKYNSDLHIKWLGLQSRDKLFGLYDCADYMIFPSKLETWGLPISEFKESGKGEILADLPYAHETIGNYDKVTFFDPDNYHQLAGIMQKLISMDNSVLQENVENNVAEPFARNWNELLQMLL